MSSGFCGIVEKVKMRGLETVSKSAMCSENNERSYTQLFRQNANGMSRQ